MVQNLLCAKLCAFFLEHPHSYWCHLVVFPHSVRFIALFGFCIVHLEQITGDKLKIIIAHLLQSLPNAVNLHSLFNADFYFYCLYCSMLFMACFYIYI